ncbi:hypothetical protein [Mediterraneibacter hominis]|nr:hypothetical protein [Mediterraneibacter hominis]
MKPDDIVTIISIDWNYIITSLLIATPIIASCILCFAKLWSKFKKKFGITTKRDKERELLVKTAESLSSLQQQHTNDMEDFRRTHKESVNQSIRHDQLVRDNIKQVTEEIRDCIAETQKQINQFAENRVHDREQSFRIQKELVDSIQVVAQNGDKREKQIEALMFGSMELLGDKIDQRFSRYISLDGIPENEVEEFEGIYAAYKKLGGNHKREEKYKYVKQHLKVIPVVSKLKQEEL